MTPKQNHPTNLIEATRYFSDPDVCVQFVASLRWPQGPVCPACEGKEHSYLKTRRIWKCKACKKQFSVKVGTIFEDSPIPLDKWMVAIWIIANAKNGVSSHELARSLGVTQKTAWFLNHRIRTAMTAQSFAKLSGEVEVDETFIGGKFRNMHKGKKPKKVPSLGPAGKTVVLGMKQRDGEMRAGVVYNVKRTTLQRQVRHEVEPGSSIYTDQLRSYTGLRDAYDHAVVDHAERYVDGKVSVNQVENFWALLKRGLYGTYVSVAPFHLFRYLDERLFTFNQRHRNDFGRFAFALGTVSGRRLTYAELTGKDLI